MVRPRDPASQKSPITSSARRPRSGRGIVADAIFWEVVSIHSSLEELSYGWAQMLGVNVHQWLVIMAIQDLDLGPGVSVRVVADKLQTDPSIVTTQSKGLEKGGWILRRVSTEDARVVLMTLTAKAIDEIAAIKARRDEIKRSIFEEFDDAALTSLQATLSGLSARFARARRRLMAEL